MSLNKFGRFVHPYYKEKKVKIEGETETVGAPKQQFYEVLVNLYGSGEDTYSVSQYRGPEGEILHVIPHNPRDMFSIHNEKPVLGKDLISKKIKEKDLITVYPANKMGECSLKIRLSGKQEETIFTMKPESFHFRIFKFPFITGKIVQADVSPSNIRVNSKLVDSLENIELNFGDSITFIPRVLFFEANLLIRCPISNI